jgi:hypothetical protein
MALHGDGRLDRLRRRACELTFGLAAVRAPALTHTPLLLIQIALAVTWRKANKWGCICGTVGGFILGLTAWLVTTATLNNGVLTVSTTGQDYPLLAGALTSIGVGGIVSIIWSLIDPENFDFESTRAMNTPTPSSVDIAPSGQVSPNTTTPDGEKDVPQSDIQELRIEREEIDFKGLDKTFVFAAWSSVTLFCILIIVRFVPLSSCVASRQNGWLTVVSVLSSFLSSFPCLSSGPATSFRRRASLPGSASASPGPSWRAW